MATKSHRNTNDCTNLNPDLCWNNSLQAAENKTVVTIATTIDCNEYPSVMRETQLQLLILFAISTSVSLLNLGALLIVYDKDPEIDEIPNVAERQRASSGEFL